MRHRRYSWWQRIIKFIFKVFNEENLSIFQVVPQDRVKPRLELLSWIHWLQSACKQTRALFSCCCSVFHLILSMMRMKTKNATQQQHYQNCFQLEAVESSWFQFEVYEFCWNCSNWEWKKKEYSAVCLRGAIKIIFSVSIMAASGEGLLQ